MSKVKQPILPLNNEFSNFISIIVQWSICHYDLESKISNTYKYMTATRQRATGLRFVDSWKKVQNKKRANNLWNFYLIIRQFRYNMENEFLSERLIKVIFVRLDRINIYKLIKLGFSIRLQLFTEYDWNNLPTDF